MIGVHFFRNAPKIMIVRRDIWQPGFIKVAPNMADPTLDQYPQMLFYRRLTTARTSRQSSFKSIVVVWSRSIAIKLLDLYWSKTSVCTWPLFTRCWYKLPGQIAYCNTKWMYVREAHALHVCRWPCCYVHKSFELWHIIREHKNYHDYALKREKLGREISNN